ncbi:integrator complex subunit [Anaeramoeba flamelloides]|uniref:Integrator complex subunit n=1 Tax=Anaeramoeba flamelloides TaxID=1746091 RepID=A0AAV7Z8F3_9EUKA|nr:integrator complex subunit [Anaeramoeba flamelloides]
MNTLKLRIFDLKPLDHEEEIELHWINCYEKVQKQITSHPKNQREEILRSEINKSTQYEQTVYCALLFILISMPESFDQIVRISREFSLFEVEQVELLLLELMRQIRGSDTSEENIKLNTDLLDILVNVNEKWLFAPKNQMLVSVSCYTFLRLITDHHSNQRFHSLATKETNYILKLFKNKKKECYSIGRDLIRLLQNLHTNRAFKPIWDELLTLKPNSDHEYFIDDILNIPTPRIYLQSRITPKMETQLLYLLQHVNLGNQRRYQLWFSNNFLSVQSQIGNKIQNVREGVAVDIARFLLSTFNNKEIKFQYGMTTRWALIGWLLTSIKSHSTETRLKCALFYDLFFFTPGRDNLQVIEPTIELMIISIVKYRNITENLMKFVNNCEQWDPRPKKQTVINISRAFNYLIKSKIISFEKLSSLYKEETLDQNIRETFLEKFRNFFGVQGSNERKRKKPETKNLNLIKSGNSINNNNTIEKNLNNKTNQNNNNDNNNNTVNNIFFKNNKSSNNNNNVNKQNNNLNNYVETFDKKRTKFNQKKLSSANDEQNSLENKFKNSVKKVQVELSNETTKIFGSLILEIRTRLKNQQSNVIDSIDKLLKLLILNYNKIKNKKINEEIIKFIVIEVSNNGNGNKKEEENSFQIIFEHILKILFRDQILLKSRNIVQSILKQMFSYEIRVSIIAFVYYMKNRGRLTEYFQLFNSNDKILVTHFQKASQKYPKFVSESLIQCLEMNTPKINILFVGNLEVISFIISNFGPFEIDQLVKKLQLKRIRLLHSGSKFSNLKKLIQKSLDNFDFFEQSNFFKLLVAEFSYRKMDIKNVVHLILIILQSVIKPNQFHKYNQLSNCLTNLLKEIEPDPALILLLLTFSPASSNSNMEMYNETDFVNISLLHWFKINQKKIDSIILNLQNNQEIKKNKNYLNLQNRLNSFIQIKSSFVKNF